MVALESAMYRITPTAPALVALTLLTSKVQELPPPRWINANFPFSELAGRAEQAVPGSPSVVTSTSGAVSPGEALTGPKKQSSLTASQPKQPSLRCAAMVCRPAGALDFSTLTEAPRA